MRFSNISDFLNWITTNGRYQNFQSYLYATGYSAAWLFMNPLDVVIGVWNQYLGGSQSPTFYANVPADSAPPAYTPKWSVGNKLAHAVANEPLYYIVDSIDPIYYHFVRSDGVISQETIRAIDTDSTWVLWNPATVVIPGGGGPIDPPAPGDGGTTPTPEPGSGGDSYVPLLVFLAPFL
jgi:hypothetical protein